VGGRAACHLEEHSLRRGCPFKSVKVEYQEFGKEPLK